MVSATSSDRQEARRVLAALIPAIETLDADIIDNLLNDAVTVDVNSLTPGDTGYSETFDIFLAAASCCVLLGLQQAGASGERVKRAASEGTSIEVEVDRPDYQRLAATYRALSPTLNPSGVSNTLGVIEINIDSGYRPTSQLLNTASGWQQWV